MREGRASVGHPVDVATGEQFTAAHDVAIAGSVPLLFRRLYNTRFLERPPSILGPGWVHDFEAILQRDLDGFLFQGHDGERIEFDDHNGEFENTGSLLNISASMELRREGDRLAIYHWHNPETPVQKYVFQEDNQGALYFVALELPSGLGLALEYDPQGRLASVTQIAEGRRLVFEYADSGLLSKLHLGRSKPAWVSEVVVARYSYDERDRLVAVHDARGFAREYGYDSEGRLILERGRRGGTYRMKYDSEGRCIESSGEGEYKRRQLIYDSPRTTRVVDSLGRETIYLYNDFGQVECETLPNGSVLTTRFDDLGRVVAEVGPLGSTTTYVYDGASHIAEKVYPNGATLKYEYNAEHQPTRIVEPDGAVWQLHYERGALIERIDPLGRKTQYIRDARNAVVGAITPSGNSFIIDIDETWTDVALRDNYGLIVRKRLDLFMNPVEAWDANGLIARFAYDELGRLSEVINADHSQKQFEYDPEGEVVRSVDAMGNAWTARYSAYGDCIEQLDPLGRRHAFTWNSEGYLSSIRNPKGEVAQFEYDVLDNTTRIEHFDGSVERAEYDAAGRIVGRTKPDGTVLEYEHDEVGNIVQISSGGHVLRTWKFNLRGAPIEATSQGSTVAFEYQTGGRLKAEIQHGRRVEYAYDEAGQLVRRTFDNSKAGPLCLEYDGRGRLVTLATEFETVQAFSYKEGNRFTERELGSIKERRGYDFAGRLCHQELTGILSRTYRYDAKGSLKEFADTSGISRIYDYDATEQLVASKSASNHHYRYDANGNLTQIDEQELSYGRGNRLERSGDVRFDRDPNGQITCIRNGAGETRLSWDPLGQLTVVVHADGTSTTFGYDAFGRRLSKEHAGVKTSYWWSSDDLLAEQRDDDLTEYAIWDAWALAVWENGEVRHVVSSQQGVPQNLLDNSGRVVWHGERDDWGGLSYERGASHCCLGLPGQIDDPETGFSYNRFRYYSPSIGQFLSPDPRGFGAGSNFFRYAPNTINWSDPLGLECGREDKHVFRALDLEDRQALDRGEGIAPRGQGGTIAEQVAGKKDTKYTSASETIAGAKLYGDDIVAIGVDQAIAGGVGFVDHNNVMQAVRREGDQKAIHNASRSGEVLFKGPTPIPPTAITPI